MAVTMEIPRLLVFAIEGFGYLKYVSDSEVYCGRDESVVNPAVKIEVERAKINKDYFHLRFCYTNRYWGRGAVAEGWISASAKQPEEDTSNPSCTLFQYIVGGFQHVQSGGFVNIIDNGYRMYITTPQQSEILRLTVLDWESFVKLPNHVAFKGDNGQYLKGLVAEGHNFLQFAADDDPNWDRSGYEIQLMPDGHIRIKSDYFNKFWIRGNDNWIWADSSDGGDSDNNTRFWPVKIDENTIALRNEGNQNFCNRYSDGWFTNDLNAAVVTITKEARIGVEELVLGKKIYNVTYQMEYARIYDVQPYLAGTATAINNEDEEALIAVEIKYEDQKSHSFTKGVSVTAGVTTTIEANLLEIVKGSVQVSYSVSGSFEWNDTTTTTLSVTATGSVPVPTKSTAVVRYVGSKGTCDVPFSYTQTAVSSTDGTSVQTEETDGIFKGVNYYDFSFQFDDVKRIGT